MNVNAWKEFKMSFTYSLFSYKIFYKKENPLIFTKHMKITAEK